MIDFNLITGFLGSGKTCLLSNILSELSNSKRIAVIQNEFAPSGIDGKELKQNDSNFKLVEINNGSVFCVCQLSNFINNLKDVIATYQPEIIFLEASGLADPISIMELLQTDELKTLVRLNECICLVDAVNFYRGLSTLVRFKHQLMIADKIIINKTDLFDGDMTELKNTIKEYNTFAEIFSTTYAKVDWEKLSESEDSRYRAAEKYFGKTSEGRPNIIACVLRSHQKISEENLKAFMIKLQETCLRIKGFINLDDGRVISVHSVYDTNEMREINHYVGPSELTAFGSGLTISYLRKLFKAYAS